MLNGISALIIMLFISITSEHLFADYSFQAQQHKVKVGVFKNQT